MKIKISIPKDSPQVSIEVDPKAVLEAFKEVLQKLPFKVEIKGKEEEGGEHKQGNTVG